MLVDLGYLSDFGHLVGTGLSDTLLFVQGQLAVKREDLHVKEVERDDLGHVKQVLGNCNPDLRGLVDSERVDLRHDKALSEGLAHILRKIIHDLQGRDSVVLVLIVGQLQSQVHNVLFVLVLDDVSDIKQFLNGSVSYDLGWVVQEVVQESEYLPGSHLLFGLRALLLHQLNERNELLEEGDLDFRVLLGQDVQRHNKPLDQVSLLDDVGDVHQSLHEIQLVIRVEVFDVVLDRLGRGRHVIERLLIALVLVLGCNSLQLLHAVG